MKKFTIKGMVQKTIISLLVVIMVNFTIPVHVNAGIISWAGNTIGEAILTFTAFLGDTVVGGLHKFVLGTEDMFSSVMLPSDNPTVTDGDLKGDATGDAIELDGSSIGTDGVGIPNIMVCPEYIFENRIPLLDANFVNPGQYIQGGNSNNKTTGTITGGALKTVIASWYRAFRNIAIVGLLSILVYIGIRILLGSTSQDKAKYKERLVDWLVGLCLVFVMHYIMAGTMMITENITYMLSKSIDSTQYDVVVTGKLTSDGAKDTVSVKENLTGYVRLMAQTDNLSDSFAYTLLYIIMIIFTIMFLITYIKRVLYMAFFTMIAPLVALTYPIDKVKDGKAQAFDMWFKEYTMNAIIQPIHLILYSVFIGSAIDLAVSNPLYAIVAMAFLTSAEKFVKQMFGLDKAKTPAGLAAMAGGALAMKGIGNVVGKLSGKGGSSNKLATSGAGDDASKLLSRGKTPGVSMDSMATLAAGTGAGAAVGGAAGSAAGAASGAFAGGPARKEYDQQANNGNEASGNQQNNQNSQQNGGVNNPLGGGKQLSQQDLDKLDMDRSAWEREANNPDLSEEDRENARAHIAEIDEMKNKNTKKVLTLG